jgi:hypothetical protein
MVPADHEVQFPRGRADSSPARPKVTLGLPGLQSPPGCAGFGVRRDGLLDLFD